MKKEVVERFISYAQMDTQSNEDNETCPSTPGQMVLAHKLVEELKEIGMEEVRWTSMAMLWRHSLRIRTRMFRPLVF